MDSITPPGLVGQTLTLVFEEAFLWEIGNEATDHLGHGRQVVHGPWNRKTCRDVLLRWFDLGWLDCVAYSSQEHKADWLARASASGAFLTLARPDARALLDDPALWTVEGIAHGVMLCRTDATDGMTYEEWVAPVLDLDQEVGPDG